MLVSIFCFLFQLRYTMGKYLVQVDRRLPELLVGLVEISHSDLTEVSRMVLVQVGAVVVLTTGHTATTGVLAVLANTTVTGLDMTAAVVVSFCSFCLSVCLSVLSRLSRRYARRRRIRVATSIQHRPSQKKPNKTREKEKLTAFLSS